ncbi:MAG: phosphatidylglycerophosphatase A [Pseudomonadota bacterium]
MSSSPSFSWICQNPTYFLAFGFGSGLSPKAPGTWGSLAALPLCYLMMQMPWYLHLLMTIIFFLAGVYICGKTATDLKVHDHPGIVWDEFVGMMLACLFLQDNFQTLLLVFVLFRFFDIFKPWPIQHFDKNIHGGLGIMLDDLLAGMYAWLTIYGLVTLGWISAFAPH